MKRRGFLGALLALPFAKPALGVVLNAVERMGAPVVAARGRSYLDLAAANEILKELYSGQRIEDAVFSGNALIVGMEREAKRRAALTPEQRATEDRERQRRYMRERVTWHRVRDSGYAAWRDKEAA